MTFQDCLEHFTQRKLTLVPTRATISLPINPVSIKIAATHNPLTARKMLVRELSNASSFSILLRYLFLSRSFSLSASCCVVVSAIELDVLPLNQGQAFQTTHPIPPRPVSTKKTNKAQKVRERRLTAQDLWSSPVSP